MIRERDRSVENSGVSGRFEKATSKNVYDALYQSDLLVKLNQNVFALDWHNFAENYALGYGAIYVLVETAILDGGKHRFPFLILKDEIAIGGDVAPLP